MVAIIQTLCYSDIFDFPLTLPEIRKFLIGIPADESKILKELKKINFIKESKGYYFFSGKTQIITERIKKEAISRKKLESAIKFAQVLFLFPSIKAIAVTGSLALLSSDNKDDIDLLLITARNRIWTTRFLSVLFLKLTGVYRNPLETQAPDKLCINMFLDENHLTLPSNERDLYSAHEIVQMRILFARPGFENKMESCNPWVKKYLPNAINSESKKNDTVMVGLAGRPSHLTFSNLFSLIFDILELILKNFQLSYMKSRRTTELIRDGYLRFHPRDARKLIMEKFNSKLKKYTGAVYTS